MKILSFFFILVLSVSQVPAQVKTGGGGGPDPDSPNVGLQKHEAELKVKYILADLSKELMRIEKNCNERKSFPKGYNFVDSFYSLSLKKNNNSKPLSEQDCTPSKKVASCLKTKELKSIMAELNQANGVVLFDHLKKNYKLEKKEAQIMLKFFSAPQD